MLDGQFTLGVEEELQLLDGESHALASRYDEIFGGLEPGDIEALMKPHPAGGTAVLFVNLGTGEATGRFALAQLYDRAYGKQDAGNAALAKP